MLNNINNIFSCCQELKGSLWILLVLYRIGEYRIYPEKFICQRRESKKIDTLWKVFNKILGTNWCKIPKCSIYACITSIKDFFLPVMSFNLHNRHISRLPQLWLESEEKVCLEQWILRVCNWNHWYIHYSRVQ